MAGLSVSLGLAHLYGASTTTHPFTTSDTSDMARLLPSTRVAMAPNYTTILEEEPEEPAPSCRDNRKFKLFIIWALAFLTGVCIFSYTVTLSDFLGKSVFKGTSVLFKGTSVLLSVIRRKQVCDFWAVC
jgi:hypothetical protein